MKQLQLLKHVGVILLGLVISFIVIETIRYFNPGILWHVEGRLIKVIFLVGGLFLLMVFSTPEVLIGIRDLCARISKSERMPWMARAVNYFSSQVIPLVSKYSAAENIFIVGCICLILLLFYKKLVAFTWLVWFFPGAICISFLIFLATKETASKN